MNVKKLPNTADAKWLLDKLESVSIKQLPKYTDEGKIARSANDPASGDSYLRGEEISKNLFASLQQANGETGGTVTLKNADGSLTRAGELFQKIDLAKVTRDAWFDPPNKDAVLNVDFRGIDMGYFRGNQSDGQPIHVTGVPDSSLTVYWQSPGPAPYVAPSKDLGILYYERGKSVDIKRSGNTSVSDPAASFKSDIDAPKDSEVPDDIKGKNLNRDPSTVRRELSSKFFRDTLKVPSQRIEAAKWFANGWYQGLRDIEEPLDETMWKDAVHDIDPKRDVPKDVWIFKSQWQGGVTTEAGTKLDKADLEYHRTNGSDGAEQYRVAKGKGDQVYGLETGKKKSDEAYGAFAKFVKVVNGIGLKDASGKALSDDDPARFNTDAYRKSVTGSMDVYEMLRAYTGLIMTGAWDNIINPSNFAWVAEKHDDGNVKWSALPIDLDSTWGIRWDGQPAWQDLDVLLRNGPTENVPVIWKNLLANDQFKAYVLDYIEFLMSTSFTPDKIGAQVDPIWDHRSTAAYQESDTPDGAPRTGRPFTNDQLYKQNKENWTIQQNGLTAPSIRNFVEWRDASAHGQIDNIRKDFHVRSGVDFSKGELEPKS